MTDSMMDADQRQAVAGEFVLGTLDARSHAQVKALRSRDAELDRAIGDWEQRLSPLAALALPESPPPDLWDRIEAGTVPPSRARSSRSWAWLWPTWSAAGTLAAAGFAAVAFLPPQAAPGFAVLVVRSPPPAFVSEADSGSLRGGARHAAAEGPRLADDSGPRLADAPRGGDGVGARLASGVDPGHDLPDTRVMQLWELPPNDGAPVSLGTLPLGGGMVSVPPATWRKLAGRRIAISVEPDGGSPTDGPTGPVIFTGELAATGNPG